jgi:hypothetical protein
MFANCPRGVPEGLLKIAQRFSPVVEFGHFGCVPPRQTPKASIYQPGATPRERNRWCELQAKGLTHFRVPGPNGNFEHR